MINRKDHHALWEKCLEGFSKNELALIDAYQEKKEDWEGLKDSSPGIKKP